MTFPGWVDRIGKFDVVRMEGRRPGGQAFLSLDPTTRRVIWHRTEGHTLLGAVSTLRANFSAPTLVIGPGINEPPIAQMRPFWAQAATVRGDNSNAWQVEVVGFSRQEPHLPDERTREAFVEALRFFRDELGVPLDRPDGWRDDCADITGIWATEGNSRRTSGRAPNFAGHVMHLEWPGNTHWDQGAITWARIFEEARDDMAVLTDAEQKQLRNLLAGLNETIDPETDNPALAMGKRIGRVVEQVEAGEPDPEPTTGITRDEADVRYVRKGEPVTVAPVS